MYDFMYKNKGAISVFLVIVLVPMLVLSSIFVDMSCINLARSVAESSGELSLNTALTSYDAVLKDMYGLFATAQDTDDLFESLEDYYRQSIESAGVPSPDAEKYTDQVMNYLKGFVTAETGTDDLLNMNLTSFEVTKSTDGSLANPAILKSQIVEFMKYRAPIGLGTEIFDAFGTLKNLKKQTQLVEKKNEFYEKQASMMETLQEVWTILENYQYRDAKSTSGEYVRFLFPEGDYAETMSTQMEQCQGDLQRSIALVVRYLYYADNYMNPGATRITCSKETDGSESWTIDGVTYKVEKTPQNKTGKVDDVIGCLKAAYTAVQSFRASEKNLDGELPTEPSSSSEKIQFVSKVNSSQATYKEKTEQYIKALINLKNAYNKCDPQKMVTYYVIVNNNGSSIDIIDTSTEDGGKKYDEAKSPKPLMTSFVSTQIAQLKEDTVQSYNGYIGRANEYYNETREIVNAAKKDVNDRLKNAKKHAVAFNGFLDEKIGKLDEALKKLNKVKSDLENSESDYNKALAAWKSSANGLSGDTLGENDKSEIEKLEKVLTKDKVEELITRVNAAKGSLERLKGQVNECKIGSDKWTGIGTGYSYLVNKYKGSVEVDKSEKESDTIISEISEHNATYNPPKNEVAYQSVLNLVKLADFATEWEESKSPDLTKGQVGLYNWLYSNFDGKKASEKYNGRDIIETFKTGRPSDEKVEEPTKISTSKADNIQEQIDKAAKDQNSQKEPEKSTDPKRPVEPSLLPSGQYTGGTGGLDSEPDTEKGSDAMLEASGSALGKFDGLFEMLTDMATTLRDDMYVCNYIMNMFSYSTYEAELTVKNDETFTGSWYEEKDGKYVLKNNEAIKSVREQAKTLTKEYIEPNKNYLYGREVEYIIYGAGDDGTHDPRMSAYGTIYMLRFALNTVYAFMDTEISSITNSAATALFGTPPLTPLIPVAKIAMTLGFALAESAYDLYQLKSGVEVPLMKNKNTWVMKPSNGLKSIVGEVVNVTAKEVTGALSEKAYEVLSDIIDMTDEELENKLNESQELVTKLADAAIESTVGEISNQCGQVLNELVSICNHVNDMVKAETDNSKSAIDAKVAEANKLLDEWLAKQENNGEGDIVYKVKKEAVGLLKENNSVFIQEVFKLIDDAAEIPTGEVSKVAKAADELNDKLGEIKTKIEKNVESTIVGVRGSVDELKAAAVKELKAAAAGGVESLRKELNKQIDSMFGTSPSKKTGAQSVVSSLTSWAYSDYLQLFLLVGIVRDSDTILLRTADVIELNMQQITGEIGFTMVKNEDQGTGYSRFFETLKKWFTGKDSSQVAKENKKAFKLSKAYTYLNVKAVIEVKPMMMTLPLIANTVKSQLTGTDWYQITYSGNLGY